MDFEHKMGGLDDEDLVVGEKEEKNWKGIVISLLVIGSILGAIMIAITLLAPTGDMDNNRMKLDFDQVISDAFKIQKFNGTWLSDHEIAYVDQNGSIVIFDAASNKSSSMLVKTYDKTLHTMAGFKLSADRQSILFVTDIRKEFGAVVSARYAIFNISSQTVESLDDIIKSFFPLRTARVQYAAWAPNGADSLIFIESGDIYILPDFSRSYGGAKCLRVTKTGALSDSITNGLPDSLYRANIFHSSDSTTGANEATLWWSGDGQYLAYLTFDDAQVDQSPIEYYDSYSQESNVNGKIHYERYPRAGGINPRVSVHVADVGRPSSTVTSSGSLPSPSMEDLDSFTIAPPAELIKQQQMDARMGYYVTYVGWLPTPGSNQLLVMWSNRAQNSSILTSCENSERSSLFTSKRDNVWKCDTMTTFSSRIPPSVDAKQIILPAVSVNGTKLVFFALPRPDSVIGDHFHVAMLRGDERAAKYLSHGEFDIDRLISYDPATDSIYFEAKVSETAERHLYKITNIAQASIRQTKCLTCVLEESCGYNYAHISLGPNPKYFVHECLGPSVPRTYMRSLEDPNLKSLHLLGTNNLIENLVRTKQMPIEKFIAIKTSQQMPFDVRIKLYLPNEIEEEKDKRFPMLIESSEIDRRNVWKKFDLDWGKYLASRKQLIYAKIDCTRARPSVSMSAGVGSSASSGGYSIGPSAGDQEDSDLPLFNARDQADVIKFLVDNVDLFPYIDRRRIAIWGPTSTSAYVALATTANDDIKAIQCTVAVSPITNWRYMSSYMAEHYLGLPWLDANSLKYERSSLLKRNYEFSTRKLLIVHGTADEQVHIQHSMQFIKSLTDHLIGGGIMHQMQLYPDVGHSLDQVKRHFYVTLDGFIDRCFYQKPIAIKATEWKGKARPKLY